MDASVENRKYTTELAASAEAVAVAPSEPAPESRVPEPPEQLVGAPGPSTLPDALPDASHPVQLNTSLTETAINVTSLVEGARADEDRADIFALKPIKFFDQFTETYRTVKILLQNKFGPCAALSLCNCLALRGELKLEGEQMSYDTLAALLGDLLINKAEGGTVDGVADVLELLPTLRHGLDVDVKFGDVYGFDASPSLSIFKSFDVHLLHGWTVDPQDTDAWAVLVEKAGSYNRAVELLSEEPSSPTNTSSADLVSKLHDSEVVRQFLLNTPGQLTAHGLTKLSEVIPPFGIAVLFRHNHFATIYKQASNELYLLCTDIGFANSGATWESLTAVDGDTMLVDEYFVRYTQSGMTPVASDTQLERFEGADEDADLAFAISLQEEENRRAAEAEARMRESAAAEQVAQASQSNLDARLRQVTGISGASNSPGQQRLPPSAQLQGRGPPTPSKEKKKDKSSCAVM